MNEERYDLYLSYSGRQSYIKCPNQYKHKYILKTPVLRDPKNSLLGSIIGKIFEWFYQRKFWSHSDPIKSCLDSIPDAMTSIFRHEKFQREEHPGFVAELRDKVYELVPHGVETIRKNALISPISRAEVDLTVVSKNNEFNISLKIGGKADFIHNNNRLISILDGKASKYRDKYADPEQLVWYAVQHYIKYGVSPSKLGFIFWSFPEDPISWIDFNEDSLRKNYRNTFIIAGNILNKNFPIKTSSECTLCDYKDFCPEGNAHAALLNSEKKQNYIYDSDLIQIKPRM